MDIERFEHTAAWLEYCEDMPRFHAETEAARRQGFKRHEVMNAIRNGDSQSALHQCATDARQPKGNLPGMQPQQTKEKRPVSQRELSAGRHRLEMLALRV
ncbi:hypothetical protein ACFFUT_05620 [Pseudohalocynthiibacter aestuariivivens]|uniref:Uncharacterized protein n=1 Tax=Pseudohalocynthiibacter aestuariivivens TaxID=1591409 RepID=A0ABV5JCS0_9RHOB|nr:hypothetical protein [Pseudohalocynthiibacter aestuariivivens]MBS9717248.1 hypothetical protein [Pseudohalocynthiibacter aestuariivivens]